MAFDAARSAAAAAWSITLCGGALTLASRLVKAIRAVFVAGAVDESRPAGAGLLTLTCSASYTLSGLKAAKPEQTSRADLSGGGEALRSKCSALPCPLGGLLEDPDLGG